MSSNNKCFDFGCKLKFCLGHEKDKYTFPSPKSSYGSRGLQPDLSGQQFYKPKELNLNPEAIHLNNPHPPREKTLFGFSTQLFSHELSSKEKLKASYKLWLENSKRGESIKNQFIQAVGQRQMQPAYGPSDYLVSLANQSVNTPANDNQSIFIPNFAQVAGKEQINTANEQLVKFGPHYSWDPHYNALKRIEPRRGLGLASNQADDTNDQETNMEI